MKRAEIEVALEDAPDQRRLFRIDDEPAIDCPLAERHGAPIQIPRLFDAAILSRMRSAVTSRPNWANESSTFSVSLPIEVEVLKDCVTETKEQPAASKRSTSLAKSASERVSRSIL